MGTHGRHLVRIWWVAVVFALTGCGGGGTLGGSVTLFEDTFAAINGSPSTLADNWLVFSVGSTCTASNVDTNVFSPLPQGNPTPGLVLKCQGSIIDVNDGSLQSLATYALNTPLTFAVDARVDAVGDFIDNPQRGMIFSLRALSGLMVAYIDIRPTSVTYYMNSGGGIGNIQFTQTYPVDAFFHRYAFVVNGSGNAEWRRDGILQASTTTLSTTTEPISAIGNLYIKMIAPPSTATVASNGHFDNVRVTAP